MAKASMELLYFINMMPNTMWNYYAYSEEIEAFFDKYCKTIYPGPPDPMWMWEDG